MSSGQVYSPINYKIQIKRVIVDSLREYCDNHTSQTMRSTFVTIEYPMGAERYPTIIVGFNETKLASPVGHYELTDNLVRGRWIFQGNVKLEIMALTSLERDYISDHIVNLAAFGKLRGANFEDNVIGNNTVDVQMNLGYLQPLGETTMSGVSWGLTDGRIYQCGYVFPVIGTFESQPSYYDFISSVLAGTTADGSGVEEPWQTPR